MLTAEEAKRLFDYDADTGELRWRVARARRVAVGQIAGSLDAEGYRGVMVMGRTYKVHRIVFLMVTGRWPYQMIDHINGDPSDNRWINLREATRAINCQNQRGAASSSTVGFLGVSRQKSGRFQARIDVNGRNVGLGTFDTPEEAHSAYVAAKRAMHPGCTI